MVLEMRFNEIQPCACHIVEQTMFSWPNLTCNGLAACERNGRVVLGLVDPLKCRMRGSISELAAKASSTGAEPSDTRNQGPSKLYIPRTPAGS